MRIPRIPLFRNPSVWLDVASVVLAVIVGLSATLFVRQTLRLGLLTMTAQASYGWPGETVLQIPPFGEASAHTHAGPLRLTLTVTSVDLPAVRRLLAPREEAGVAELLTLPSSITESATVSEAVEAQSRIAVRDLRRLAALAAVVAFVAAALVPLLLRRRWRIVMMSGAIAFALVLGALALAMATFNAGSLREPRLSGALAYVPTLQSVFNTRLSRIEELRLQVAEAADSLASYYADPRAISSGGGLPGTYRVLQVGDLHMDPVGAELARTLASTYNVSLVLDVGDIGILGNAEEAQLLPSLVVTSAPVVYVAGNHDSESNLAVLRGIANVSVTTTAPVEVGGLTILPVPDPQGRDSSIEPNRAAVRDAYRVTAQRLREAEESTATPPDIILLHSPVGERAFIGLAPLVISGHTHSGRLYRNADTVRLNSGTLGGMPYDPVSSGRRRLPHSASILYYTPGTPRRLIAIDRIAIGVEGETTLERTVVTPELLP